MNAEIFYMIVIGMLMVFMCWQNWTNTKERQQLINKLMSRDYQGYSRSAAMEQATGVASGMPRTDDLKVYAMTDEELAEHEKARKPMRVASA